MAIARAVLAACCISTLLIPDARAAAEISRYSITAHGSGRVYLPSARFGPPKPPLPYPSVVPGTFEFLVDSPN